MSSTLRNTLVVCSLAVAAVGCANKPTENKATATVAAPVDATKPIAGGVSYNVTAADSKVGFVGAKVTGKHEGSFGSVTGIITVPGGDVTKGTVVVQIDVASMTTDSEKLTGHLKSADFFDVARFPKATFSSTSVKSGGERGASHTVTGNLELHGVTKSITFPATIRVAGDKVEVSAEFGINRKDFGLVYPGKPDDLIKDEVLLKLALGAPKV